MSYCLCNNNNNNNNKKEHAKLILSHIHSLYSCLFLYHKDVFCGWLWAHDSYKYIHLGKLIGYLFFLKKNKTLIHKPSPSQSKKKFYFDHNQILYSSCIMMSTGTKATNIIFSETKSFGFSDKNCIMIDR